MKIDQFHEASKCTLAYNHNYSLIWSHQLCMHQRKHVQSAISVPTLREMVVWQWWRFWQVVHAWWFAISNGQMWCVMVVAVALEWWNQMAVRRVTRDSDWITRFETETKVNFKKLLLKKMIYRLYFSLHNLGFILN